MVLGGGVEVAGSVRGLPGIGEALRGVRRGRSPFPGGGAVPSSRAALVASPCRTVGSVGPDAGGLQGCHRGTIGAPVALVLGLLLDGDSGAASGEA